MGVQSRLPVSVLLLGLIEPGVVHSQIRAPAVPSNPSEVNLTRTFVSPDVEVNVRRADGNPIDGHIVVQLVTVTGQLFQQLSVKGGSARFSHVPKSEYRVLVIAPGYHKAESKIDLSTGGNLSTLDVELVPISDAEDAVSNRGIAALNPRAQKEVGKALESLRTNKPNNALNHLQSAQKAEPNSAEVEYLFGVYASQLNDPAQAKAHWNQALAINPEHLSSLLELSQELVREKKSAEAVPYLNRAVLAEPSSWRAHALLAEAQYMQGNRDRAIEHAERALDLGHDRAASLEPFLAGLLVERGDTDRGVQVLQEYVRANPSDSAAAKELEQWKNPEAVAAVGHASASSDLAAVSAATALPVPSNWLPPDVDEKIPTVEAGAACSLEEVLQKVGDQLVSLIHNVDRFTATESIVDETINKWGVASNPEKRKFAYLVSISEIRPGFLSVDEYRDNGAKSVDFPDGVITNGLPALVLIFHPFYSGNYDMTCEGLARMGDGLAWQVHFRQRADRPTANRGFRVGAMGSLYPAALRGRAWIAADTYQILRLETDLVHPVPEVRLVAEHAAVEYGAVSFRDQALNLWLPQSAEVYFDWRGQRVHRRHSYGNYMLFSIDEKEQIGSPKGLKPSTTSAGGDATTPLRDLP
jgi:tetratricopeptide (TPR) repeat protein